MSIGLIILIITGLLVIFGAGQRALDRLRLTDKQALLCIALIIGLGFVPDIPLGGNVAINLGGCVMPLILCGYLFVRAGTWKERGRAIAASLVTAWSATSSAAIPPMSRRPSPLTPTISTAWPAASSPICSAARAARRSLPASRRAHCRRHCLHRGLDAGRSPDAFPRRRGGLRRGGHLRHTRGAAQRAHRRDR